MFKSNTKMAISYIEALRYRKPRLVTTGHFLVKTLFYTTILWYVIENTFCQKKALAYEWKN
jgi:hypothetical protein